ncbi:MAG TPA: TonB-dependent receptor [Steroidobacteraceae bacterium]|nr:TonB-dependent receptor [Steroidobacteraceae bacterium]
MQLRNALACVAASLIVSTGAELCYAQAASPSTDQANQTAQTQQLQEVVVTGVRRSIGSALELKKVAQQVEDSIVAEDIGKLPDNNVIEALQHVTGVQISRNAAEANQLLIRGLPDIETLLNGREIFTSTGRFVSLQDIPAELLSRVDVVKSPTAADIAGGIAGVVDVRLHRPFDFQGFEAAGTAMATHSSLSGKTDPRASLLLSDRWDTSAGEFGVLADVSYSKDRYKEEILDNYISSQPIGPVPGSTGPGGTAYLPLTEGAQSILGNRQRTSVDLSTQWRPNSRTELYAEGFYTGYRNDNYDDFFVGLPWICANPATATVFPGTDEVKTVTAGCYDLTSNQSFVPKTDTYQAAIGGTWTGERVKFTTEVDYTNSHFSQDGYILDSEYYPPPNGYSADFDYNGTGTPYMNVTGVSLTDPTNFHIRQLYDQWTSQKGNEADWRGDLAFRVDRGWISSIDTGARFADRFAYNRADNQGGLDCRGVPDPASPTFAALTAAIASPACFTPLSALPGTGYHVTSGSQFDGQFGISQWLDADPNWLIDNIAYLRKLFDQSPTGAPPPADPTQSFDDREISYSLYGKLNFAATPGSLPLIGNFGLRLIETQATMKGNSLIVSTPNQVNYTFNYLFAKTDKNDLELLPSLNARLQLNDDLFLRFAASQTVTRPQFAQLDPGLSLSASTATLLGSGSSGNPNLSPEKSDNVDLSLEDYFGRQNALTGALFYRRVKGYIQSAVAPESIAGITYQVTLPTNAPAGAIKGAEVAYTQFFTDLPGIWSGLGLQANGTYVSGPFQNISKWSYNLIGIYEKGPVEMRVAYNWRSGFDVGPAPGGGQQPGEIYSKAQPWLDLSFGYHVLGGLTVTFDAKNMLNSYYQDYFGSPYDYPRDTRRFDQTYAIGFRYRL